jgi:hypothetical protein
MRATAGKRHTARDGQTKANTERERQSQPGTAWCRLVFRAKVRKLLSVSAHVTGTDCQRTCQNVSRVRTLSVCSSAATWPRPSCRSCGRQPICMHSLPHSSQLRPCSLRRRLLPSTLPSRHRQSPDRIGPLQSHHRPRPRPCRHHHRRSGPQRRSTDQHRASSPLSAASSRPPPHQHRHRQDPCQLTRIIQVTVRVSIIIIMVVRWRGRPVSAPRPTSRPPIPRRRRR